MVVMENIEVPVGTQETWHRYLDACIRADNCNLSITSSTDDLTKYYQLAIEVKPS